METQPYLYYGVEFDQEFLDAIDKMAFDHGETTIWAEKKGKNCRLLPNMKSDETTCLS